MKRKIIALGAVAWLMIMAIVGTALITAGGSGSQVNRLVSEEEYAMIERYRRLDEVRQTLMEQYYQPVEEDTLVVGAIRGMMDSLGDPYTFYYTPEELAAEEEESSGVFHGVGMVVQRTQEGALEIIRVYPDSPAEEAGLRAGDQIIGVDGELITDNTARALDQAVDKIRGEDGTPVTIMIQRDGEALDIVATRGKVNVSYVDYSILYGNIGYVNIAQFTGNDVTGFKEAVDAFRKAYVSGVIIDLRNNPGGLLTDVLEIADMVLPEGLVTYVEDRQGNRTEYSTDAEYWKVPMVVMVNGMSASASELFTGAFQDDERGTVVGTRTFGKGIVQTMITFASDGAGMQYTTESYFSPKGRSIHGTGLEPDVVIELDEGATISTVRPDPETDNQLRVAIEELQKLVQEG